MEPTSFPTKAAREARGDQGEACDWSPRALSTFLLRVESTTLCMRQPLSYIINSSLRTFDQHSLPSHIPPKSSLPH